MSSSLGLAGGALLLGFEALALEEEGSGSDPGGGGGGAMLDLLGIGLILGFEALGSAVVVPPAVGRSIAWIGPIVDVVPRYVAPVSLNGAEVRVGQVVDLPVRNDALVRVGAIRAVQPLDLSLQLQSGLEVYAFLSLQPDAGRAAPIASDLRIRLLELDDLAIYAEFFQGSVLRERGIPDLVNEPAYIVFESNDDLFGHIDVIIRDTRALGRR